MLRETRDQLPEPGDPIYAEFRLIKTSLVYLNWQPKVIIKLRHVRTREVKYLIVEPHIIFYVSGIEARREFAVKLDEVRQITCRYADLKRVMLEHWCAELAEYPDKQSRITKWLLKNLVKHQYKTFPPKATELSAFIKKHPKLRTKFYKRLMLDHCFHGSDVNIEDHTIQLWYKYGGEPAMLAARTKWTLGFLDIEVDVRKPNRRLPSLYMQKMIRDWMDKPESLPGKCIRRWNALRPEILKLEDGEALWQMTLMNMLDMVYPWTISFQMMFPKAMYTTEAKPGDSVLSPEIKSIVASVRRANNTWGAVRWTNDALESSMYRATNLVTFVFQDQNEPDKPLQGYLLALRETDNDEEGYTDRNIEACRQEILDDFIREQQELFPIETPEDQKKYQRYRDFKLDLDLRLYDTELEMLKDVFQLINEHDPDALIAHNGVCFDYPVLMYRLYMNLLSPKDTPMPLEDLCSFKCNFPAFLDIIRGPIFRSLKTGMPHLWIDKDFKRKMDPKENTSSLKMPNGSVMSDSMFNFAKRRITSSSPPGGWGLNGMLGFLFPGISGMVKKSVSFFTSTQRELGMYNVGDVTKLVFAEFASKDISSIASLGGLSGTRSDKTLSKLIVTRNQTTQIYEPNRLIMSNNRSEFYRELSINIMMPDGNTMKIPMWMLNRIIEGRIGAFTSNPNTMDFEVYREFFGDFANLMIGASDIDFSRMYPSIVMALNIMFTLQGDGMPVLLKDLFPVETLMEMNEGMYRLRNNFILSRSLHHRYGELAPLFLQHPKENTPDDLMEEIFFRKYGLECEHHKSVLVKTVPITTALSNEISSVFRMATELIFEKGKGYGYDPATNSLVIVPACSEPITGYRPHRYPKKNLTTKMVMEVYTDRTRVPRAGGDFELIPADPYQEPGWMKRIKHLEALELKWDKIDPAILPDTGLPDQYFRMPGQPVISALTTEFPDSRMVRLLQRDNKTGITGERYVEYCPR